MRVGGTTASGSVPINSTASGLITINTGLSNIKKFSAHIYCSTNLTQDVFMEYDEDRSSGTFNVAGYTTGRNQQIGREPYTYFLVIHSISGGVVTLQNGTGITYCANYGGSWMASSV